MIDLQRLPLATRLLLRGGRDVMLAAGSALGVSISETACRAVTRGDQAALWLGPDEQLIMAPAAAASDVSSRLTRALSPLPHSLVDVSHRQIALALSGPHAHTLLNAGCPLDLDLEAFPVNMCTRTVLGKAEIVLWRARENTFHLEVSRSFAAYVSHFLATAAHGA